MAVLRERGGSCTLILSNLKAEGKKTLANGLQLLMYNTYLEIQLAANAEAIVLFFTKGSYCKDALK